jgi:Domain of unknown function (DUF4136)
MRSLQVRKVRPALLGAAACVLGLAIAGCDDHVQITRDPDVRIARGMTWAWRPAAPVSARDNRPVTSRDVIAPRESATREPDANADVVRDRVKNAIAQTLTSKGLTQVSDPATADFLADYHFAVERRNAAVPVAYPGGYPGLVCGPYGCYQGWGWGPPGYGYERIPFRAGTIVFDFLQQSTKHQVYRAVGEKPVRHDTFSLTQDEINDLVHHLLKDLKVRK